MAGVLADDVGAYHDAAPLSEAEADALWPLILARAATCAALSTRLAVICRREIAEAFGERASFFSSPGGGPVSCEVGIAVLDAVGAERLQENAAVIGAQLKRDLTALADHRRAMPATG